MRTQPSGRTAPAASAADRPPLGLSPAVLFTGYTILCRVPLLLAVIQGSPLRDLTRELSGGLIMVAYVMMLAQFIMSGRLETLTGRTGIDRTMRFHVVATRYIMAAVIVHPLLYSVPDLYPNPMDAVASLHRRFFVAPTLRTVRIRCGSSTATAWRRRSSTATRSMRSRSRSTSKSITCCRSHRPAGPASQAI